MAALLRAGFPPDDPEEAGPVAPASLARRLVLAVVALLAAGAFLITQLVPPSAPGAAPVTAAARSGPDEVRILSGEPASLDPAGHGDATSATIVAQLYESLTAFDPGNVLRPALAESWTVEDGGRRIVFTLREGLAFSDGSPLTAGDVVFSWRRVVDPADPSPLASLLVDVVGVEALLDGRSKDPTTMGVRADGDRRVVVDLVRPATDFPAVVSAPPFAVVSSALGEEAVGADAAAFVGSGGYVIDEVRGDGYVLRANEHYWSGEPPIATVHLVTDLGGGSAVDAFTDGDLDIAGIPDFDARWIAYDETLGPQLRSAPALAVNYYGFDTTEPPFDDARVRLAFAKAVDWRRLAALDDPGTSVPATGMIPAGIPGRPDGDFLPVHDPDGARSLLTEAGYPAGAGFPEVTLMTSGGGYDEAVVAQLRDVLGVAVVFESLDFGDYVDRLEDDAPDMWALSWVADYPGPNDFLGVLVGSTSTSNYAGWRSEAFDAAIEQATSATDAATASGAYAEAQRVLRDEVPVVPVSYGVDWRLTRAGLLGATPNGMGITRFAGLAWADAG